MFLFCLESEARDHPWGVPANHPAHLWRADVCATRLDCGINGSRAVLCHGLHVLPHSE